MEKLIAFWKTHRAVRISLYVVLGLLVLLMGFFIGRCSMGAAAQKNESQTAEESSLEETQDSTESETETEVTESESDEASTGESDEDESDDSEADSEKADAEQKTDNGNGSSGGDNPAGSANGNHGSGAQENGNANAAGTGSTGVRSSGTGLHVSGSHLVDGAGNIVQLRGISTHGLQWYPQYVNQELFSEFHDKWGMNVIRLAMYTGEGGYCSGGDQAALKQLVKNGVSYASNAGMYVIIDWHILSDGNPNTYKSQSIAFFSEMAQTYAGQGNVIYEICNEPNGGTGWGEIRSYAVDVISAIRQYDKDAVIIVGTPNWSQFVNEAQANPITEYDNIMYALHFYAATHKADLRSKMTAAMDAGLPIFVTEYGICDASGNGGLDLSEANQWVSDMNRYGISYCNWSLCNKAESASLIRSSCNKTSGLSFEDLSPSGQWLYQMLTGKSDLTGTPVSEVSGSTNTVQAQDAANQAAQVAAQKAQQEAQAAANAQQTQAGQQTEAPKPKVQLSGSDVSTSIREENSWDSGDEHYTHYVMSVKNQSSKAGTSWVVEVPFDSAFSLDNSWNGVFTVKGTTLRVSSMDYNGELAAGQETGNIGFIVKGGTVSGN